MAEKLPTTAELRLKLERAEDLQNAYSRVLLLRAQANAGRTFCVYAYGDSATSMCLNEVISKDYFVHRLDEKLRQYREQARIQGITLQERQK